MTRTSKLLSAALLLAALAIAGCGDDDDATPNAAAAGTAAPKAITVAVMPILEAAPVYVAKERGFFAQQGLEVKITTARTSSAIVPGVVSGQYDVGFSNMVTFLLADAQGLGLKAVAAASAPNPAGGRDMAAVIATDPAIADMGDLAGKRIGVNALNNIAAVSVNQSLRGAGVDPKSVKLVELGFPEQAAALAEGRIDAAFTVEPFLALAKQEGAHVVGHPYLDVDPDTTVAGYLMRGDAIDEDPAVARRFAAAVAKAARLVSSDRDALRDAVGAFSDIDPKLFRTMVVCGFPTSIDRDSVRGWAELMVEDGLIDAVPDVDALVAAGA